MHAANTAIVIFILGSDQNEGGTSDTTMRVRKFIFPFAFSLDLVDSESGTIWREREKGKSSDSWSHSSIITYTSFGNHTATVGSQRYSFFIFFIVFNLNKFNNFNPKDIYIF